MIAYEDGSSIDDEENMTNMYLDGASQMNYPGDGMTVHPPTPPIQFGKPELDKMQSALDQMQEEYTKKVVAHVHDIFKQLFEKHYIVDKISWVQYTPYFNDGEECTFSVSDIDVHLRSDPAESVHVLGGPVPDYDDEGDDEGESIWGLRQKPEHRVLCADLEGLQNLIHKSEDQFEHAFGDHKRIIVSRKGIDITEFDHE